MLTETSLVKEKIQLLVSNFEGKAFVFSSLFGRYSRCLSRSCQGTILEIILICQRSLRSNCRPQSNFLLSHGANETCCTFQGQEKTLCASSEKIPEQCPIKA